MTNNTTKFNKINIHEGCGGEIVFFSSFTENYDVKTPVCTRCNAIGEAIRTKVE